MAPYIREVWEPFENQLFAQQASMEEEVLALYKEDPAAAEAYLTDYSVGLAEGIVERYWLLGDQLWVRFNNLF